MKFYIGLDDVHFAEHFEFSFISVNRLWRRRKQGRFKPRTCIIDSGAFTEISEHGGYRTEPEVYAAEIERWKVVPGLELAVSQDYMCEPFILDKTGLTVRDHQRLTIDRFDRIRQACSVPIMPVLQGYRLQEYLDHLDAYGDRISPGMRVGIGSVCKRNTSIAQIEDIVSAISTAGPGLLLHGFGVKTTALKSDLVWNVLHSADSMAWSDAARKVAARMKGALEKSLCREVAPKEARRYYQEKGIHCPNAHDWREAKAFEQAIQTQHRQAALSF